MRLLFGLGFDVATEIGMLVPPGRAAASNLLFSTVLLLVVLFAAGMCLMATAGGAFMNLAYRWGNTAPVHKVFYNLRGHGTRGRGRCR